VAHGDATLEGIIDNAQSPIAKNLKKIPPAQLRQPPLPPPFRRPPSITQLRQKTTQQPTQSEHHCIFSKANRRHLCKINTLKIQSPSKKQKTFCHPQHSWHSPSATLLATPLTTTLGNPVTTGNPNVFFTPNIVFFCQKIARECPQIFSGNTQITHSVHIM
jgi:hypothetical protein